MSSETATLCRLGASAIGLAPGPTTDAVIATIQGDGILQYSVTKQVGPAPALSPPDLTSRTADFGGLCVPDF